MRLQQNNVFGYLHRCQCEQANIAISDNICYSILTAVRYGWLYFYNVVHTVNRSGTQGAEDSAFYVPERNTSCTRMSPAGKPKKHDAA